MVGFVFFFGGEGREELGGAREVEYGVRLFTRWWERRVETICPVFGMLFLRGVSLLGTSERGGKRWVSVCLDSDGRVVRIGANGLSVLCSLGLLTFFRLLS